MIFSRYLQLHGNHSFNFDSFDITHVLDKNQKIKEEERKKWSCATSAINTLRLTTRYKSSIDSD